MIWLAKNANNRLSVVQTLRFLIVNKRFACVSLDKKKRCRHYGTIWLHVRLQQSDASVLFSYITFPV